MNKLFFLFVFVLLVACEILPTAPTKQPPVNEYIGPPIVDFDYDNSPGFPGYIRFYNKSMGANSYLWSFGFKQPDGNTYTLAAISPRIKFPSNGSYQVILSATGKDNQPYSITKTIVVTNN